MSMNLQENYEIIKKRNEEIQISENNYSTLIQNIPSVVYRCRFDESLTAIMLNDKIKELSGYEASDIINNKKIKCVNLIYPADIVDVIKSVRTAVEKHESFTLEYRILARDGSVLWVYNKGSAQYDENNNVKWIDGFIYDITDRKSAETALTESESKFRTLFLSSGDAAFVMKKNMFIDCNEKAMKMFGLKREQIINSYPWFLSPEFQEKGISSFELASQKMKNVVEGNDQIFEWIHKRSNGELFDAEVCLSLIDAKDEIFLALARDITERKKAEKQLRESKLKFEAIFNQTYSFIGLLDNRGILLEINDTALKSINKKANDVIGKPFWNTPWWNHSKEKMQELELAIKKAANGEFIKYNTVNYNDKGKKQYIDFILKPIFDNKGNTLYLIAEGHIITEQKELEEELRKSMEQNRLVIKNVPVVIWKTSEKGITQFISDNVQKIYGYTANEIYKNGRKYWLDRIHPDDIQKVEENFSLLFNENIPFNVEYRIKSKDNKWIWLNDFADTVVLEGNVKFAYGVFHEITDSKRMEGALIESEENFRNIFNSSTDGMLVVDFNFNVLAANNKLISMVKVKPEEVPLKNAVDFFSKDDINLIKQRLKLLKTGNELSSMEIIIYSVFHEAIPVEINSRIISYEKSKAILTVIHDISERKNLQRKLFEAQVESEEHERERYAKELHDGLGPLLSTCKIYFHSLQNQVNETKRNEQMNRAGELLEDALISIKEISNNLSPHILRNYGLFQALHSFVDKLKNISNITFSIDSDAEKRYPEIIEFTLYRSIIELINNSVKYSDAGNIAIEIYEKNFMLIINYSEDGKGFNYEKRIKEGKGFGLLNLENRIRKIDGNYEYVTSPGKGVKVKISIKL